MSNSITIKPGDSKIWITGFPYGRAMNVEVLGKNPNIDDGFYIRKPNGGTDTTTSEFLFDLAV